jgi:hypothetical protein
MGHFLASIKGQSYNKIERFWENKIKAILEQKWP